MLSTETIATVAGLAEAAGVPETVIWRWIRTGRLPAPCPLPNGRDPTASPWRQSSRPAHWGRRGGC